MSKRSSRAKRAARRERLAARCRPVRYLECPCCGHPDCVPQGNDDPDFPGRATWWDDQRATCPECKCEVRVYAADDYRGDMQARAEVVGDDCWVVEKKLRDAALDFLADMGEPPKESK